MNHSKTNMSVQKLSFEDALTQAFQYKNRHPPTTLNRAKKTMTNNQNLDAKLSLSTKQCEKKVVKYDNGFKVSNPTDIKSKHIGSNSKLAPKCISLRPQPQLRDVNVKKPLRCDGKGLDPLKVTPEHCNVSRPLSIEKKSGVMPTQRWKQLNTGLRYEVENDGTLTSPGQHVKSSAQYALGRIAPKQSSTTNIRQQTDNSYNNRKSTTSSTSRSMKSVLHTLKTWQQPSPMNKPNNQDQRFLNHSNNTPIDPLFTNSKEFINSSANAYIPEAVEERFIRFKGRNYKIIKPPAKESTRTSLKNKTWPHTPHIQKYDRVQLPSVFTVTDPNMPENSKSSGWSNINPTFDSINQVRVKNETSFITHNNPSDEKIRDPLEISEMYYNGRYNSNPSIYSEDIVSPTFIDQKNNKKKGKRTLIKTGFPKLPKRPRGRPRNNISSTRKSIEGKYKPHILKVGTLPVQSNNPCCEDNSPTNKNSCSINRIEMSGIQDKHSEITNISNQKEFPQICAHNVNNMGLPNLSKSVQKKFKNSDNSMKVAKGSKEEPAVSPMSLPEKNRPNGFIEPASDLSGLKYKMSQNNSKCLNASNNINSKVSTNKFIISYKNETIKQQYGKIYNDKRNTHSDADNLFGSVDNDKQRFYELVRVDISKPLRPSKVILKKMSKINDFIEKDQISNGKKLRCRICSYRDRRNKIQIHVEESHNLFVLKNTMQKSCSIRKSQCQNLFAMDAQIYIRLYQQDIKDILMKPVISEILLNTIKLSFERAKERKTIVAHIMKNLLRRVFDNLLRQGKRREKLVKFVVKPTLSRIFNEAMRQIRLKAARQLSNKPEHNATESDPAKNIIYKIVVSIQCSFCKICFSDTRELKQHMKNIHLQELQRHISNKEREFNNTAASALLQYYRYRE